MKQTNLLTKLLLLCLCVVGSVNVAWADTETPGNTGTKDAELSGVSYSVAGTYIAGAGSTQVDPMVTKGVKVRLNKNSNKVIVTVTSGYTITNMTVYGITNSDNTTNTLTSLTVDGGSNILADNITIAAKNASTASTINTGTIAATNNITMTFSDGATQGNFDFHFTYTAPSSKYTVSFNAGSNGTCGTSSLTEESVGAGVTLPSVTPNTGYDFNGWFTASSGGTKAGNAGDKYEPSGNITLYAQYSAKTYTVTLNTNGGTINAGNVTSYTYGEGATLPTNVTKDNYGFTGWFDNSGLTGVAVTAIADDATGDKEFWAKWNTAYSVTHTLSNVTKTSGEATATEGSDYTAVFAASSEYKLPDDITVTIGGVEKTVDTDYTWNKGTGTVNIPAANVTGAIVITVSGVALEKYSVTHTLSNVTTSSGATGANAATENTEYSAVFAASSGYALPSTITVTIGGATKTVDTDYTWNKGTGTVTILAASVTDDIEITVTGLRLANKIIYSLTGGIGSAEATAGDASVSETSLVLSNTAGRITLTAATGEKFKNGDDIYFAGTIGKTSKNYGINYGSTNLYVAGTTDPLEVSGTLSTLSADGTSTLVIARYDGTTTTITNMVISRAMGVESETFNGVKINGVAGVVDTDYSISGTVITLANSYSSAPTVALIDHITYSDESTSDNDVDVDFGDASEGFFTGTATIGATTYTVKAPYEEPKEISYTGYSDYVGTRTDTGVIFATENADGENKWTAPANKYMSNSNKTLTGWKAVDKTVYTPGTEYSLSDDIEVTPVFTSNDGATFAETLEANKTDFNVTWDFDKSNSANGYFAMEGTTGFYVRQATINTKSVDIPMAINTTSGKVSNANATGWTQVNAGAVLTVPVVNNSVITVNAYQAFVNTEINGGKSYVLSNSDKTATYTYTGETGTVNIVIGAEVNPGEGSDIRFISTINVTYPAPKYTVTYSAGTGSGTVPTESSKNEGATFTVAAQSLMVAPTGKYFVGWNDGTANYAAGDTYTMGASNVTLTAQWATSAETDHYHYSYKDATRFDGTYKNPLGATATLEDEQSLSDGNLCTSLGGITSVAIASAKYDGKDDHMNAYLKILTGGTSKVTITIADGYAGTLKLKAGGYSANPTISVSNSTLLSGSVGGVATTEDNYNELVYALTSGTHDITCSSRNMYISEMDLVTFSSVSGTITTTGWNTFSSSYPLDLNNISGGKAYYAESVDGTDVVLKPATGVVSAGVGLMIKGTPNDPFTINVADKDGATIKDNLLVGLPSGGTVAVSTDGSYNYVYAWQTANPSTTYGFYNVNSKAATLGAGKAYLHLTSAIPIPTSGRVSIIFDDEETTGIKAIDNEKLTMDNYYDLSGRKVAQPQKGLYIVNGKKVIVK